ncbi:MAG TPA: sigma-70 family RNA polymerase sigma factor [Pseudomonadales bacterium]|nr:sigma-70 family RNA polymerase sigma factor [Pseudomonadales bacterium]
MSDGQPMAPADPESMPDDAAEAAADAALMAAWRAGDDGAFEALYARWSGPTWRFLVRQCGAERAQELHQDTWMQVIRGRDRYRESARFAGWLFTLARNCIIDDARRRGVRPDHDHAGPDPETLEGTASGDDEADPAARIDAERDGRRLAAAVARLPRAQREVVMLRWEGGLTLPEIAALTEASLDTVKSRLRYALGHLHKELSADGG